MQQKGIKNTTKVHSSWEFCATAYEPYELPSCLTINTFHRALSQIETRKSYVKMFFVDYSSAFNTIMSDIFNTKLDHLQIPSATCS